MLRENHAAICRKIGFEVEVVKIGVRDLSKPRELPSELFTDDLLSIVNDPAVDVVLELIGGIEPASELVEKALLNNKNVVTANKELMARHGSRLVHLPGAGGWIFTMKRR